MKIKQTIFSLVMLLAYATAMAHSFVPHCHHAVQEESVEQHHENHHHSHKHHEHESHGEDELHVRHSNHVDHGILEFLYCLLSETDSDQLHIEDQNYRHQPVSSAGEFSNFCSSAPINLTGKRSLAVKAFVFAPNLNTEYISPAYPHDTGRGPPYVA